MSPFLNSFWIIGRDEVQPEREKLTFAHFTVSSHTFSLLHNKTMQTKKKKEAPVGNKRT